MKDLLSDITLKQKLWWGSVSVLAVLLFLGFSFIGSLSSVKREMNVMVDDIQPAVLQSLELSQRIQQVSGALGFYLLSKEEAHREAYVDGLKDLQSGLLALQALPAVSGHPQVRGLAQRVAGSVSEFADYKELMLKLAAESNLNRPAIRYASTHINPKFREMLQLLSQMALAEEEEEVSDERKALLRSITNLRISWITMNNEIRLFLAFRTPAALDNMKLYRETVTSQISELQSYEADLNLEQADALEQFSLRLADYFANLDDLIRIHSSDKWSTDAYLVRAELTPLLAGIQEDLNRIIALQQANIQQANREVSELYEDKRTQIFLVVSMIFFAVTAVSWLLTRSITRPMQQAVGIAGRIANGRLDNEIEPGSNDEMGQLLCSLKTMQNNLRERIESDARIAGENQRIRTALDNVSSSVMMADSERNILYINKTAQQLFRDIEEDVKRQFPEFSADRLLGTNIDIFHKNPSHQAQILERMTESHQSQLKVGGRTLWIVASPVFDPDGQRLGTAVEWTDRTAEVLVEGEMNEIVAAAHHGDLSRRIDLTNKQGFFKNLGSGINSLIDQIDLIFGDLNQVLGRMADGNLSEPIRRDYQGSFGGMKSDVNNTLTNLRQIIGTLREATLSVRQVSNEILEGNDNLSARTEQQASSLEETAATMEQITGTVKHNSDNAQQASHLANSTRNSAEKGGEVIRRAVVAMAAIEAASSRITEIIGTIDDIAFQTNLLSLNASVEAARAGEQGRGFAVVATEVRNLASRSAVSAREIKALIQDSVEKVKAGVELVKTSGDTLDEIILGVKKVDNIVSEIAAASREQAVGIEQVNQAITNMDELTQKNAALAVEASNASSMMSKQASEMEQLMARFNIAEPGISQAEDRGILELNIYSARTAHLSWKLRLREFLDGKQSLSETEAVSHRDCELGKWLYGAGLENLGHLDEMQQLEQVHARMHALIKEIVEAKNLGNNAKAEALYADVEGISSQVIELLTGLEERQG